MGRGFDAWANMEKAKRDKILKRKPYYFVRCNNALSFPDTLMSDEELMHIHLGPVLYTGACQIMDVFAGERYRIHVDIEGEIRKVSLHKLLRKTTTGEYGVRLCHKNPSKDFRQKHFYVGEQ